VTTSLAAKANAADVTTSLATKVDKVTGKGLSTNDYTTAEKTKLAAVSGTNTGDQDLSGYATASQLATKANASDVTTSLATKEDASNKSNAALGTSTTFYPTQNAVKTYVDAQVLSVTIADADASTKGKLQLAGDLAGTAASPSVVRLRGTPISSAAPTTAGHVLTFVNGSATWAAPSSSGIPYTGATQAVNLGAFDLTVNGLTIGRGNGGRDSNSAFGRSALASNTSGSNNTATGFGALEKNTNGGENTAHGAYALQMNTGDGRENSAFGFSALKSNTSGIQNTATGFNALSSNTIGNRNTATGWYALGLNTEGDQNSAFGWYALVSNTTGKLNTAVGEGALKTNRTGDENSAFGQDALANNSTGKYNSTFGRNSLHVNSTGDKNTVFGWSAGNANTVGNNNTAIGAEANFGANNLTNATAIGYQATASADNMIQLGNGSVTVIRGTVAYSIGSDSRIKKNIVNSTYGLATVLKLRPVEYNLTSNDLKQVGFIAQEVQKLVPEVVTGKEGDLSKGEILGITYSNLVPVLTKAIQEQQKQIEDQNAKIAAQQKQIEELIKLVKGQ
jgi:hypothetical protein